MAAIKCPLGSVVSRVVFASYGTPEGSCGSFKQGLCHQSRAQEVVEDLCIGESECRVSASTHLFGETCPLIAKNLRLQVQCTGTFWSTTSPSLHMLSLSVDHNILFFSFLPISCSCLSVYSLSHSNLVFPPHFFSCVVSVSWPCVLYTVFML